MHKHIALTISLALAAACRNSAPEPTPLPPPTTAAQPSSPQGLPPNHPPMGHAPAGQPAMEAPAQPARELRWTDPVGWRRTQPSSSMRRAQYAVPGPAGSEDAEVAVFYFGAGQGGSVDDNVRRWHGQFAQEGAAPAEPPPTTDRTVHGLRVHLTERFGRFGGAMGMPGAAPPPSRENWGMLGAIVETDQGPWFFKMTGPRATVEAARARFDDLVASFQMP